MEKSQATVTAEPEKKTTSPPTAPATDPATPKKFDFKSLHFGWFIGHILVVITSFLFFLSVVLFRPSGFLYRTSYLASVISYGIVLYNSYKPFTSNESYFKRMLLDENAQYLIIAVLFLFTRRIAVTLLPFFIYSLIHVLKFTEKDLIPNVAPHQSKIQTSIKNLLAQHQEKVLELVAKIEVCGVMTRLVLGLFVFRSSLLSVFVYGHFLRMRYYMSTYTRDFLTEVGGKIDKSLTAPTAHPKIPPAVIKAYATAKEKLNKKPSANATAAASAANTDASASKKKL